MTTTASTPSSEIRRTYRARGGVLVAVNARDKEILVEGPAGTGKTRGILEKLHRLCLDHGELRVLITRKTLKSMATSVLATLTKEVHDASDPVRWFGGSEKDPAAFRYDNGALMVVGGMDDPDKILSAFYDIIYVNEATQLTLEDWESLTARLRHGAIEHMRIIGDCNPSYDKHWLLLRCQQGKTRLIKTTHQDNPVYFNDDGTMTPLGETYMATLQSLTGSRYQRLFLGQWVGMENAIYPQLDPFVQLASLPERIEWREGAIGVDYGKTHEHPSTVVAVQRDSTGVYWVRECWAQTGGDPGPIEDAARSMKTRFGISRGQVDPIQEVLGRNLNFSVAKSGAGTRKERIGFVTALLDAKALVFDQDALGVRELFDEALAYRYETRETDTYIEDVVVRKDEDRVAGMEYAIAELRGRREPFTGVAVTALNGRPVTSPDQRVFVRPRAAVAPRHLGGGR